jgi:hypothetical protein
MYDMHVLSYCVFLSFTNNIIDNFSLFKIEPRGAGGSGGEIFENDQSDAVTDAIKSKKMWDLSKKVVKLTDKEMFKGGKLED